MKLFSDIVEKIAVIKSLYEQIKLDNHNEKIFLRTINEEVNDRNSEFYKMGFKIGDDDRSLMAIIRVPLEVQQHGDEYLIEDKLLESTYFMTDFLVRKAGFGGYVSQRPSFFHIEDPTSNEISLTYIAKWEFVAVVAPSLKHKLYGYPILGALTAGLAVLGCVLM